MRRPIIVGNWKMNMLISDADEWIAGLLKNSYLREALDIVVAPAFTSLAVIRDRIERSGIKLAGQNIGQQIGGSLTGEISATMLKDAGCSYVLLGHSERRQYFAETDEIVNKKISIACNQGLNIIFCVGESLAERNNDRTNEIIEAQLSSGLANLNLIQLSQLAIAYEPVWAIGTGHTATPDQAQDVHLYIRAWVRKLFGTNFTESTRILYGGSVKPETSKSLMNQSDIDGLLVGKASLKIREFCDIINSLF